MTVHFIGAGRGAPHLMARRVRNFIVRRIIGATRHPCQDDTAWPQTRLARRLAHRAVPPHPMTAAKLAVRTCRAVAAFPNPPTGAGGPNAVTRLGRFPGPPDGAFAAHTTRTHSPGVQTRIGAGKLAATATLSESPAP